MKLLGKTSHYEKILAYMKDPDADMSDLTDHEQMMLNRWNEAFTLMKKYNTADAAAILMKRFPGISRATAYRDCANAISLFGDISKSTKEGIRHLSTEIVRDAIAIARQQNDPGEMRQGAVAIAKINGVNITDPDLPDFKKLDPHNYNINLPPAMIEVLKSMIGQGKVDLSAFVNAQMADAEEAQIVDEPKPLPDANS